MYSVIILAEQALSAADAHEVVNLHDGIEDERRYFILIPAENAQLRVEAALGALGASDTWASPGVDLDGTETQEVQQSLNARAQAEVSKSVDAVGARGRLAGGD